MKRLCAVALIGWCAVPAGNAADVIRAENEVGVVCVSGGAANTVVAVPFAGYDGGPTKVSNLLPSTAVREGTELFRCADGGAYERWTGGGSYAWTAQNTLIVGRDGTTEGSLSVAADQREVANGTGLWLSRKSEIEKPICLFGSVPTNGVTSATVETTVPKGTSVLVANPLETAKQPTIDDAAEGDTVQFPTSAGPLRTYRYASGKWVLWENGVQKDGLPAVPAGTGFWYVSTGNEVKISWK